MLDVPSRLRYYDVMSNSTNLVTTSLVDELAKLAGNAAEQAVRIAANHAAAWALARLQALNSAQSSGKRR